jgi:lipopolysaccharide export system permease protein
MTILSRHIFREFISFVVGALVLILVVFLCVDFLQRADRLIKNHATLSQVARFFLYSTPLMISQTLPMASLIASLLSLGGLSRHNEIIAMRAGGVSLARIVAPMVAGGLLLSAAGFVNSEYIMPACSERAHYIRDVEIEKKQRQVVFQQQKLWLRGPDNSIANIEFVSPNRNEMLGLDIYKLNPDYTVRERIKADRLVWKDGAWRLTRSMTFTPSADGTVNSRASDGEIFSIVENPDDLGAIVKDSEEMNFQEMWNYIRRLKTGGYKTSAVEVDLHSKLSFPVSSLIMVLISIPFSFHKVRSGGAGKGFAIALAIAFFYWTFMSVGESLGRSGALPPVAAAWLANLFVGGTALAVLYRMQRTV